MSREDRQVFFTGSKNFFTVRIWGGKLGFEGGEGCRIFYSLRRMGTREKIFPARWGRAPQVPVPLVRGYLHCSRGGQSPQTVGVRAIERHDIACECTGTDCPRPRHCEAVGRGNLPHRNHSYGLSIIAAVPSSRPFPWENLPSKAGTGSAGVPPASYLAKAGGTPALPGSHLQGCLFFFQSPL